jgi:hypothetical protein
VRTGWRDDFADADRTLRDDRIAVDIDGFAVEHGEGRRESAGERLGLAGGQDDRKKSAPASNSRSPTGVGAAPASVMHNR